MDEGRFGWQGFQKLTIQLANKRIRGGLITTLTFTIDATQRTRTVLTLTLKSTLKHLCVLLHLNPVKGGGADITMKPRSLGHRQQDGARCGVPHGAL